MDHLVRPLETWIDGANFLEKTVSLDEKLKEMAALTARTLKTKRCSILLLSDTESTDSTPPQLRVFAHYGNLPETAYKDEISLNQNIAGYVVTHKQALLVKDINDSPFVSKAKYLDLPDKSWMSAPIMADSLVIGVINVSFPLKSKSFTEDDLQLLEIFAAFVSKSLQISQLQMILRSKFVERAVSRELAEENIKEYLSINPNPNKLAKIVAKSFFRELTQAGFGANEVISIATEVLSLLNSSLEKHRQRLAREDTD
jgi:GAF domain-containing protein